MHIYTCTHPRRGRSKEAVDKRGKSGLTANPEAGVSLPQGDGKALKEMPGALRGGVAQSLTLQAANGVDCRGGFRAPAPEGLHNQRDEIHASCLAG